MNKLMMTCLSFLLAATLNATPLPSCAPELQKHMHAILKVPEAKKLIEEIQLQGPIQIIAKKTSGPARFGAFWDPDRRRIVIEMHPHISEGQVIGSLIFELHNASINSKFQYLNDLATNRQIDKENYILAMEQLEYTNSLNASKMAEKGIRMKAFPREAYLNTYSTFDEHFKMQKMSGHSDYFSRNFDMCVENY